MKQKKIPSSETHSSPNGISEAGLNHDEIAKAAYRLYEENGRQEGRDLEYWLAAEQALRSSQSNDQTSPSEFARNQGHNVEAGRGPAGKGRKNSATREEIRQLNTPTRNSPGNLPRESQIPQHHSA